MLPLLFVLTTVLSIWLIARTPSGKTVLVWLPFAFFIQLGFVAFVYGLFIILNIGYSLLMGIAANALLSILVCFQAKMPKANDGKWAFSWSIPRSTKPLCSKADLIVWGCLVIICALCYIGQFGIPPQVSFLTSDPAAHDYASYAIATGEPGRGAQYLSHLAIGSVMAVFDFAISQETSWIVFEIMETFFLFLSGAAFYSVLAVLCKKLSLPITVVFVVLYVLGYPLNNMLFGFSYLGVCVTVIALLAFTCLSIRSFERKGFFYGALSLLLYEVAISYSLFAPPIFLGVFIFLIVGTKREGYGLRRIVANSLAVFLVPSALALVLVYSHYFISSGHTVGEVISDEGGIFRDLYASFLFVAPLSFYGYAQHCRSQGINALFWIAGLFVLYSLGLFILCALKLVSTYYFYKVYFVLWLLFFLYAAYSVHILRKKSAGMLMSYTSVWLIVFALAISGLDVKLTSRPRLNPHPVAESLFSIYVYNYDYIGDRRWTDETVELLDVAAGYKDAGNAVAMTINDQILRWWAALYGGSYYDFKWWGYTDEEMIERLKDYDYVVVSFDDPLLATHSGHSFIEALDAAEQYDYDDPDNIVFANSKGIIVKAPE